jgi:crossover junction endodeoxyribonuclease RusA
MSILELETMRRRAHADMIAFNVDGTPEPKGSMRAFVPKGWTRAVVTSDNPDLKGWQATVRAEAIRQRPTLAEGAVDVTLSFRMPRPKALPKTKPVAHVTRPDVDKLARSVLDALTGVVWRDDSQVASLLCVKRYARLDEPMGVVIGVLPSVLEPRPVPAPPVAPDYAGRPMRALLTPDAPSAARPAPPAPSRTPRQARCAALLSAAAQGLAQAIDES